MAKQHRWVCPLCGTGALGSSQPRKDATVRFCLRCSEKTGRLVARTCPVLDRKRDQKAALRKAKAQRQRDKQENDPRVQTRRLFKTFLRLDWPRDLRDATIRITQARDGIVSGYAYTYRRHISMRVSKDPAVNAAMLLHEMAHLACNDHEGHGDQFRSVLTDAAHQVLGADFQPDDADLGSVYGGLDAAVRAGFRRKWGKDDA